MQMFPSGAAVRDKGPTNRAAGERRLPPAAAAPVLVYLRADEHGPVAPASWAEPLDSFAASAPWRRNSGRLCLPANCLELGTLGARAEPFNEPAEPSRYQEQVFLLCDHLLRLFFFFPGCFSVIHRPPLLPHCHFLICFSVSLAIFSLDSSYLL